MSGYLNIECSEWQELSESFPLEMEVIVEMMIEAEEEICV